MNINRKKSYKISYTIIFFKIQKCIELYEQMQQRMGVALVGPSGTGKSTILKLLKAALEKLHQTVKYYVVNPKSMPRTQFFGQVDVDTRQWKEGVLTTIALKIHSENSGKYIINDKFDIYIFCAKLNLTLVFEDNAGFTCLY